MKYLSKIHLYIILISLLITIEGCSKKPNHLISEKRMAAVIADMTLAEAYSNRPERSLLTDSAKRVLRESILKEHGVSNAEFDSTLMWYGRHMDKYSELYKKVDSQLEKREKNLTDNIEKNIDNTSLWAAPEMLTISPKSLNDGITFTLPGSSVKGGEALKWSLNIHRLYTPVTFVMIAEYQSNKHTIARTTMREAGKLNLILPINEKMGQPQRISGYMHLNSRPPMQVWIDSISLIKTGLDKADTQFGQY